MTEEEKIEKGAEAAYKAGSNGALVRQRPWPPGEPETGYWRDICKAVLGATSENN